MKKLILSLLFVGTLWSDTIDERMKVINSVNLSKFHKFDVSPDYYNGVLWPWTYPLIIPENNPSKENYYSSIAIFYTGEIKNKQNVLRARLVTISLNDYERGAESCAQEIGGILAEDHKFNWPRLTGYNQLKKTDEAKSRGLLLVYAPKYKTGFIERAICLPTDQLTDLSNSKVLKGLYNDGIVDQKRFFEQFEQYGLKPEITFDEIEKNIKDFHVFPIEKFPIDEN